MIKSLGYTLRSLMPASLRKIFIRFGYFLSAIDGPPESFPNVGLTLDYLSQWGFAPRAAIDIGAYRGEWAELFQKKFPHAKVLMIDAQEGQASELAAAAKRLGADVSYQIALLGAQYQEQVRFVEMGTGSSVFEESSSYARQEVHREQITLDSLLAGLEEFQQADFLKLDVQGYELEVLKGAEQLLQHVECILLEVSLIPVNKGCPLIADVLRFMDEHGYQMLDFCSQIRRRDGALWATDLLFLRKNSTFLPTSELTPANWWGPGQG